MIKVKGMLLEALKHELAPLYSLSTDTQHHTVARGIQCADFSQQFSHLASKCIIAHAISPLALRTGSNVSGWLSPSHHSTQGVQDHIAFLCYHPSAFPAPCNLCGVLPTLPSQPQPLLAHTLLHIVTQILSINTPSVEKKNTSVSNATVPLPLHGILYFIILLTDISLKHSRQAAKKDGNLLQCWHIIHAQYILLQVFPSSYMI